MKDRLEEIAATLEGIRYEAGWRGHMKDDYDVVCWHKFTNITAKRQLVELYRELNYMVCLVDVEANYREYLRGCMNNHFKQILRDYKLVELGIN